jgi:hypothetical protein
VIAARGLAVAAYPPTKAAVDARKEKAGPSCKTNPAQIENDRMQITNPRRSGKHTIKRIEFIGRYGVKRAGKWSRPFVFAAYRVRYIDIGVR